ncbi:MAG: hypothetical protein Q4G62_08480 [Pseudomonadota bacterium]|nr:hypothetical protein [Pseudomonadota bacterium]
MSHRALVLLVTALAVTGCADRPLQIELPAAGGAASTAHMLTLAAEQQQWWQHLQALCGQAYQGRLIRAPEGDDTFRDKRVVMHVRDCSETRIRIPLVIDDNFSRTWVFTREGERLLFRHDHRDQDGRPEAMTDYGGYTSNVGSADTQMFPADDITRAALPGSGQRSVWLVEIHPDQRFVYAANRVGTERGFELHFDLATPVAAPPAPWGWQE